MSELRDSNMVRLQQMIADALRLSSEGRQFPGYIYTSSDLYELEKKRIFRSDWQLIGREEELSKPGDYHVYNIGGESILVSRSKTGALHAFYNVCAHRGAQIAQGTGNAKMFVCPYHSWSYRLDGQLIGVTLPENIKNFDKSSCKLSSVRVETWGGFVFVNLNPDAPSLSDAYGAVFDRCEFLRTSDMRVARKLVLEPNCNWKLVSENIFDLYHLNVVHANSFARDFDPKDFKLHRLSGGMFCGEYRSQSCANPEGKSLFGSIEWLPGDEGMAFGAQILPTLSLIVRHDAVYAIAIEPLSQRRCRLTAYTLFPAAWSEDPEFDAKADQYNNFMNFILAEDLDLLAALHDGISSDSYVPGPASELESPVYFLTRDILDRLSERVGNTAESDGA